MKPDEMGLNEAFANSLVPTHEDFAAVYSLLRRELRLEHEIFSIRALQHLLRQANVRLGYIKLKYILLTFRELNLLGVKKLDEEHEIYAFKYIYTKGKTNLEKSNIYRKLKSDFGLKSN
jgi:hypothetical protein